MELDDLKKSWKTIDEKLQDKQLITDDELAKIMQQKMSNAHSSQKALVRTNLVILALAVPVLIFFLWMYAGREYVLGKFYFWTIIGLAVVALPWSVYTIRYLKNTRIYDMPLTVVVERINRYNYWMMAERVIGIIILFALALISIIHLQLWKIGGWFPYFVYGVWGTAFIVYLLCINRLTFRRLKKIRRNLAELKEVNDEN